MEKSIETNFSNTSVGIASHSVNELTNIMNWAIEVLKRNASISSVVFLIVWLNNISTSAGNFTSGETLSHNATTLSKNFLVHLSQFVFHEIYWSNGHINIS